MVVTIVVSTITMMLVINIIIMITPRRSRSGLTSGSC